MSRSIRQQVDDALYYLEKPNAKRQDYDKAIEILSDISGKNGDALLDDISNIETDTFASDFLPLKNIEIAIIVGHEPGGGAMGERKYNKKVAKCMNQILELGGAKVFMYEHKTRAYNKRQDEMRDAVNKAQKNNRIVFELHYDAVSYPSANGYHFQYRGAKRLAEAVRDRFHARYPNKKARRNNGIYRNTSGNGSGFLRKAPGWALLVEPFFRSSPSDWDFFKYRHYELATVYCLGMSDFISMQDITE